MEAWVAQTMRGPLSKLEGKAMALLSRAAVGVRRCVGSSGVVRFEGLEHVQVRLCMRGSRTVRLESLRCREDSAEATESLAVWLGGGQAWSGNCFRPISRTALHLGESVV
jgi:hypothetical protein